MVGKTLPTGCVAGRQTGVNSLLRYFPTFPLPPPLARLNRTTTCFLLSSSFAFAFLALPYTPHLLALLALFTCELCCVLLLMVGDIGTGWAWVGVGWWWLENRHGLKLKQLLLLVTPAVLPIPMPPYVSVCVVLHTCRLWRQTFGI